MVNVPSPLVTDTWMVPSKGSGLWASSTGLAVTSTWEALSHVIASGIVVVSSLWLRGGRPGNEAEVAGGCRAHEVGPRSLEVRNFLRLRGFQIRNVLIERGEHGCRHDER